MRLVRLKRNLIGILTCMEIRNVVADHDDKSKHSVFLLNYKLFRLFLYYYI